MLVCREAVTWIQLSRMFCKDYLQILSVPADLRGYQWERYIGYKAMSAIELALKAYMLSHKHWPCMQYQGYQLVEECHSVGFPVNEKLANSMKDMPVEKEDFFCVGMKVDGAKVLVFAAYVLEFVQSLWDYYIIEVLREIPDKKDWYVERLPESVVMSLPEAPYFDK